jgi:hypothetical protein
MKFILNQIKFTTQGQIPWETILCKFVSVANIFEFKTDIALRIIVLLTSESKEPKQ